MKKSILLLALIAILTLPSFYNFCKAEQTHVICQQENLEFSKIEIKDLPELISKNIAKEFEKSTIIKAEVAETSNGEKVYRVILESSEGEESAVLYKADGSKFDK